ncbi:Elongation of very long chain fatty acids protein 1 [Araneus ventricosus]|uniref:Elongation of very long chain fatty acids protein n=1 Tax=Araneus ventricosus TaxID=182803 RepID=A0A4Y2CMM6_ARAVE|nr:Elongation of very long chain fatty acids protein 1 [Araneus ventricosus]
MKPGTAPLLHRHLFLKYGWISTYSWRCEPIDISNNPTALFTVRIMWMFYISKVIEYLDTVIFVLRKKDSQINFLHVFHHSTVPLTTWLSVSYGPGGYNTFFALVNSLTHVWMYSYYGLAAVGPRMQKFLWWKKYLTLIQMIEFAQRLINADLQNAKPVLYEIFRLTHLHVELEGVVTKATGELAYNSECAFPECTRNQDIDSLASP